MITYQTPHEQLVLNRYPQATFSLALRITAPADCLTEAYTAHGNLLPHQHPQGTWLYEARTDAFAVVQARIDAAQDELVNASRDLRRVADDLESPPGVRAVALSQSAQATRTTTSAPEPLRPAPSPQLGARSAR